MGEGAPGLDIPTENAWAADRRERHGVEQFGIVVESDLGIGIGPGEVEHELAVGMMLFVERGRGDGFAVVVFKQAVGGHPAMALAYATAGLERRKKPVPNERLPAAA